MLVKRGHVCLFVDGFGVEIPESHIEGTSLKSGDSVSQGLMDELRKRGADTAYQEALADLARTVRVRDARR